MTWPSDLHTQARLHQRNTYNHTYIKFCLDKPNNLTQNQDKTTYTPTTAEYTCTTHGNAPKGSRPYLRHKATRGNNKILCTPPPHTSSSEEILPHPLVVALPNSEQINYPSSNHTYTKSTPHTSSPQLHPHHIHTTLWLLKVQNVDYNAQNEIYI